ncbi:putative uroporphyrinogen-III C-methyltransferase [Choanephora cucurbitarum]|uniref:precorrin-2 dehydrogenase n=1 Tax=Choanephora cucurbitarum TaxID=101091 RepID=A0A1C7NR76_9FUNG|nr:putative uroporphyrinogen-III C-methyltransferase [Choanephora cucurbitarum]
MSEEHIQFEPIQGGGSLVLAYQIANKKVLIVGGGNVAAQRIVSLKIADAHIILISPESGLNDEVRYRVDHGEVEWRDRKFEDEDLDDVDMVLTALDDHEESLRIGQLCRQKRIPVNVADVPPMCDFYFMSQHRDGPLQIAVSTNGKGPKLANMVRVAAAKALPERMGDTIEKMGKLRAQVRKWEPEMKNSGKRMSWVIQLCEKWGMDGMARLNELETPEQEQAVFSKLKEYFIVGGIPSVHDIFDHKQPPRITLIGGGPGDPELITVKAKRLLQEADLVVSDRLIPSQILDLVQGELRVARKVTGKSDEAQEELMEWCLEGLNKGLQVVRLKIGDPLLFGRGGEEILWFRERGFEPELVAGISSAFSAPMAAMIPVTFRGISDQVIITTGRGTKGSMPDLPIFGPTQTLVVLMAVGRASELRTMLLDRHYPEDVPACWIENANCPEERVIFGTLNSMSLMVEEHAIKAPAVLVVGHSISVLNKKTDEF